MIRVYIASTYSEGDQCVNVRRQIDAAEELINAGLAPFAPLYYHFQQMFYPHPYETWMAVDFAWVEVCDCLLRLPGKSSGADREVALATSKGIPVFYNIPDLLNWAKGVQDEQKA